MFESGAILIHLGQKSGKFYTADLVARISVLAWLMFQLGDFGPIPGQVHHFLTIESGLDRRYALARYSKRDAAANGGSTP